ncbi:MAG TPA: TonB family protein [Myxococcota bacterium]|nr:TonB family protein [Myxococcota bacterium]HRY92204.1 TonB family protein [Myxococcota bacterium]HSA22152.1 TonB family protein [Myxococcota bacterium]
MSKRRRWPWREACLGLAACALAITSVAPSLAAEGPGPEVVDVFMKALPYDRFFTERCQDKLVVGVVAQAGSQPSVLAAERSEELLRAKLKDHFPGVSTEVRRLSVRSAREAELATADRGYDVLVLGPGLQQELPGLVALAERRQVLLLALDPEDVARGAALGVDARTQPVSMVSNPGAARRQGADFSHAFLKLTRQVGAQGGQAIPPRRLFLPQALALSRRTQGSQPEYPDRALRMSSEATLLAEILIDTQGKIRETTFLKSDPLFEEGVQEALRTWRFKPFVAGGHPVEAVAVLKFDFKLNQR